MVPLPGAELVHFSATKSNTMNVLIDTDSPVKGRGFSRPFFYCNGSIYLSFCDKLCQYA